MVTIFVTGLLLYMLGYMVCVIALTFYMRKAIKAGMFTPQAIIGASFVWPFFVYLMIYAYLIFRKIKTQERP